MMVDHNSTTPSAGADADAARARIRQEQEAAGHQFEKGREKLKEQAAAMAHDAKEEVRERGEALKGQAADGLKIFADAVRSARDELDKKEMGPISGLVGQAAEGLESLSRSMQNASAGTMVESVRDFGRRNPVSFIAASVLAGIAIGRFAGASADRAPAGTGTSRPSEGLRPNPVPRAYPAGEAAPIPTTTGDI